jgi:pimeloyl-ACP methyl ester carboxylesterase
VPSGEVPVLFITGDVDDRTPVSLAESALKGFPNGRSVVVRNGGHELLVEEPVRKVVADFVGGAEITNVKIELPARTFQSVVEAARPPRRPR